MRHVAHRERSGDVPKSQSSKKTKRRKVGMTHHPLGEELSRQKKVLPRGRSKKSRGPAHSTGTRRGHRLTRERGGNQEPQPDGRYAAKGSKGGKSRGSRAGLRSAGRKPGRSGRGSGKSRTPRSR